ncbi:ferredoxin--NADP reductase, partial [gut metagenome]
MQKLTLLANQPVADGLYELTFTKPADWSFRAGQFARLGLDTPDGEPVFRAYSIASAPETATLRFLIKKVTDGQLSPRLCALKAGETVWLDGQADGTLLPSRVPGGQTMWLMATGSGLAPF